MAEGSNTFAHGSPFKAKRIDAKGNVKYKGEIMVTMYEIQFLLQKQVREKDGKVIQRETYPLKEIKSYGCHENVLSIRMGGPSVATQEIHFKLKEAPVVKELMDQVIKMNKRPATRMPSFDSVTSGFYGMNISARDEQASLRDHQLTALVENPSYLDMDKNKRNGNNYSSRKFSRSVSIGSSDSFLTSPTFAPLYSNSSDMVNSENTSPGAIPPGLDNPVFQLSPRDAAGFPVMSPRDAAGFPVMSPTLVEGGVVSGHQYPLPGLMQTQKYAVVEIAPDQGSGSRPAAPVPPLPPPGKKKYTSLDLETMRALESINNPKQT